MEHAEILGGLLGGVLIGLASAALLLFNGKIAGISGIFGDLLRPLSNDRAWRLLFLLGLLAGGVGYFLLAPQAFAVGIDRSLGALAVAGVLVGFGTRMGGGCTSGHGVCGMGRLSLRSYSAVVTFITTGAITVYVVGYYFGGAI